MALPPRRKVGGRCLCAGAMRETGLPFGELEGGGTDSLRGVVSQIEGGYCWLALCGGGGMRSSSCCSDGGDGSALVGGGGRPSNEGGGKESCCEDNFPGGGEGRGRPAGGPLLPGEPTGCCCLVVWGERGVGDPLVSGATEALFPGGSGARGADGTRPPMTGKGPSSRYLAERRNFCPGRGEVLPAGVPPENAGKRESSCVVEPNNKLVRSPIVSRREGSRAKRLLVRSHLKDVLAAAGSGLVREATAFRGGDPGKAEKGRGGRTVLGLSWDIVFAN